MGSFDSLNWSKISECRSFSDFKTLTGCRSFRHSAHLSVGISLRYPFRHIQIYVTFAYQNKARPAHQKTKAAANKVQRGAQRTKSFNLMSYSVQISPTVLMGVLGLTSSFLKVLLYFSPWQDLHNHFHKIYWIVSTLRERTKCCAIDLS